MLEVIRRFAEMLGFFTPAPAKAPSSPPQTVQAVLDIPREGHFFRRGRHYHVLIGDEAYFWHGARKFKGPVADHYFSDLERAHKFFIDLIEKTMPGFLDEDDIEESFDEFLNVIDNHVDNFTEIRPEQGIYFQPMAMKLLVCDSCVPILTN